MLNWYLTSTDKYNIVLHAKHFLEINYFSSVNEPNFSLLKFAMIENYDFAIRHIYKAIKPHAIKSGETYFNLHISAICMGDEISLVH